MKRKLGIQDFAEIIEQREGISRTEAENFVRAFFDVVEQGLEEDKFVKIKGLGTFKLIAVSERESVNINTGERFQISGHTKISFTPDAAMKELINRPFAHFEAVDLNDSTDTREFEEIDEEMEADSLDTEDNDENNEVDGEKESASENEDAGEAIDAEVEAPPLSSIDVQTNSEQEKAGKADNLQSTIDNELDGNKQQSSTISSAAENATEEAKTTNVVSQVEKQVQKIMLFRKWSQLLSKSLYLQIRQKQLHQNIIVAHLIAVLLKDMYMAKCPLHENAIGGKSLRYCSVLLF